LKFNEKTTHNFRNFKKLNFLSTFILKDLILLGNKGDGGYVIPK
jgi:hypothetical protein